MSTDEVKRILEYHYLPTVRVLLQLVNLKDIERDIIEITHLKGRTNEQASVDLNCSVKSIYNHKKKAYIKCSKAWKNEEVVKSILEG